MMFMPWQLFRGMTRLVRVNQVPDNVKRLYDRWPSLAKENPDKRASITEVLKGEGWMQEEWPVTNE